MEKVATPHYKQFLEREFQSRQRRNPGYSLRAFARDIGIQPSKLSEVLNGLRGLSRKSAETIAKNIKLSKQEAIVFLNLIDLHQRRNRLVQEQAQEKLRIIEATDGYGELSLERFKIISDWYHFAILELTETENFESSPSWIAGRLGITTKLAKEAIDRLIDFGLLTYGPGGEIKQTHVNLATPTGIPSRELREHHSQILMKADAALHDVDVNERDVSAITMAFNTRQMDEVKSELKEMRRRLGLKIQERAGKDRVYCLATHFFPVDQKPKSKKSKVKKINRRKENEK